MLHSLFRGSAIITNEKKQTKFIFMNYSLYNRYPMARHLKTLILRYCFKIHRYTTQDNSVELTHWFWKWNDQTGKKAGYFWSNIHTYIIQDISVKLTRWCWQWRKQAKRQTGYLWLHNTRTISKTHLLMLEIEQADKEKNRLLLVKHTQHN